MLCAYSERGEGVFEKNFSAEYLDCSFHPFLCVLLVDRSNRWVGMADYRVTLARILRIDRYSGNSVGVLLSV